MKFQVVCPLCGMWVHPNRFNVLKWPIRVFKKVMGGRYPNSKRGIVRQSPMEVTPEMRQVLFWRLEELADHLGYALVEKDYFKDRLMETVESRFVESGFAGARE